MTARSLFMVAFDYVMKALFKLLQVYFFINIQGPTQETMSSHVELCTQCHNSIPFTPSYTPPFHDNKLLRAFYKPSEIEVRAIENDLIAPSAELAALADEIKRIRSLLQTLEDRHTRLNSPITRTRQFIEPSPIRRLPAEVLGMIFTHFCHTPLSGDLMRYEIPVTLAVVCSQWRTILLDTPFLWTVIHLGPEKRSPAIVNHQLDHCGNLPLYLHIQGSLDGRPSAGDHDVYEETDEYFKAVLNRIFNALPRWKDICLELPNHQLESFEAQLQGALQPVNPQGQSNDDHTDPIIPLLLEVVTLKVSHIPHTPTRLPKIFESAPKFTYFCFFNTDYYPYTAEAFWPSHGLPWTQLKTITLEHPGLHVLDRLPSEFFSDGKEAELELYLQHLPSYRPNRSIVASKFTSLKLAPAHWNGKLPRYIEALSVPTLETVEVGCAMHPNEIWRETPDGQYNIGSQNILSALFATITRSKCTLKSFTFYVFWDAPDATFDDSFARAIIALLRVTPELETLVIREGKERGPSLLNDSEFFTLCSAPEMGGLLHNLQLLELVWAADRQPPTDVFPMLQSRMYGSALKSVVLGIRDGGDLQPEILECMNQMRESGIQSSLW